MGAWVINKWIVDHPSEWNLVRAVVLYGDPCYSFMGEQGLSRELAASYGCMPANYYPYPAWIGTGTIPFGVQSYALPLDPVTGVGWVGNPSGQLYAAANCSSPATCSHLDYTGSGDMQLGAKFVASKLVG
jgi:hypothetical protein